MDQRLFLEHTIRLRGRGWLLSCAAASVMLAALTCHADGAVPEPGPENAGMRLRFVVVPQREGTNESYQVRVDLINVTDKPIRLAGDWPSDRETGDYKDYLEADVSIETQPAILPWLGQLMVTGRTNPQPEHTLGPKESLTLRWTSYGRRLKSKGIHPFETLNPRFPTDGLYSVHAALHLRLFEMGKEIEAKRRPIDGVVGDDESWRQFMTRSEQSAPHGTIRLVSNEQLVPVGGSDALPKHTYGKLMSQDTNRHAATIDLGSLHRIEPGDEFLIYTGNIGRYWHLKVSRVERTYSEGPVEPTLKNDVWGSLIRGAHAEWIRPEDPRRPGTGKPRSN